MIRQLWCLFGVLVSGVGVCCGSCGVWFFFQGGNTVGIYVDVPYGQRLTHLPAPHPLMIKHPLDIGKQCGLVWKPKKINRGPFPLDSDLSLHQQTRHLQSTDLSEIPLAQPWPLKSTSLLDIFEAKSPYGIEAYSYSSVLL